MAPERCKQEGITIQADLIAEDDLCGLRGNEKHKCDAFDGSDMPGRLRVGSVLDTESAARQWITIWPLAFHVHVMQQQPRCPPPSTQSKRSPTIIRSHCSLE